MSIPRHTRFLAAAALAVLIPSLAAQAESSKTEQVQSDVASIVRAIYANEPDVVVQFTHPTILEAMGGKATVREAVVQAIAQAQAIGLSLESLSFPAPPTFLSGGDAEFVVVPTLSIISANAQRAESLNFQVGTRPPGAANWVYIEGSRLTPENIPVLLPGFPLDRELPKVYRKKL